MQPKLNLQARRWKNVDKATQYYKIVNQEQYDRKMITLHVLSIMIECVRFKMV